MGELQGIRMKRQTRRRLLQTPVSPSDGDFKSLAESKDRQPVKVYTAPMLAYIVLLCNQISISNISTISINNCKMQL